jgi:hypothetical protein
MHVVSCEEDEEEAGEVAYATNSTAAQDDGTATRLFRSNLNALRVGLSSSVWQLSLVMIATGSSSV